MNKETNPLLAAVERLRTELAQSRSLGERFRHLLEAAPDAFVVVDSQARIVIVNTQTEVLFGYTREELVGQPVEILVPDALRGRHVRHRDSFIAHPATRPMGTGMDLAGRRKDGSLMPVEISLSPLETSDGMMVAAVIRDITQRRLAQEALQRARDELEDRVRDRTAELEQANIALQGEMADRHKAEQALYQAQKMEAVGQLTGGVAHDFNNLLTVVIGNLQILAHHVREDGPATELIQAAVKAAKRGAELNRTLLAFSRKQRLAPEAVDFNEMITGVAQMLRRTLGEQVHIALKPADELPQAMADPAQLETALLNLAVNARDAMPEGGTLTIETATMLFDAHSAELEGDVVPGRYVMLAVSDTGGGMPPEVVARAFEPFFTTKETGKGSGLGLAMVYGFVKQSGGHVKIYSEPGIGTTVKIFLPQTVAAVEEADAQPGQTSQPTGQETILLVEDEEDVRQLACRVLESLGYRILQAGEGPTALGILDDNPDISLLFTDVVLPAGMTGPEIARQAQARRPDLKVLFTSGYTGNAVQHLESVSGHVRLLSKPYNIDDLAQMVRSALDE